MMNYGFLSGMNKSLNTQYSLMEQMSDGKQIHRPSDDPVRVIRSMQYRSAIMQNEQFVSNVKEAQSWMEISDQAVGDLSDLVSQAKSIVVRAIAPNSEIGYAAAAKQLDGLIDQAVQVANTKIGDRYVFAGQMDKTQPFQRVLLEDPLGRSDLKVDTVVYYGDDQKISMVTQAGLANVARDGINLTGNDLFGRTDSTGTQYGQATTDVFNMLIRVKEELEKTAAVTKTNSLGGTLDVDGGYTGPADYQDFAVKIDALKVRLNSYAQSNAAGGSLALSWTGVKSAMPAYLAPNSLQMRIDALKVTPTVTAPVGHTTGNLTMESTSNLMPAIPAGGLQLRVDAVQVQVGAVSKTNVLGGALNVTYNGYGTGNGTTVPASVQVRADAVDGLTGTVTAASYSLDGGGTWIAATGAAGAFVLNDPTHTAPPPLDANDTGLAINIAADMDNAVNNTYTISLTNTGKAMQASYSTDNGATWTGAAADNTTDPFRFSLGGAFAGVSTQLGTVGSNLVGDIHTVTAMTTDGTVSRASYSTDGGGTWAAATADPAAATGSFILGDSGFKAEIAKNSTNNGANTYALSDLAIDNSTEAAALSYSLDKGNTWIKATAPVVTKSTPDSGELTLGGDYTGLPAFQDLAVTVQAWKVSATSIAQTNASGGAMKIAYNDSVNPMPALNPQVRIDTVDSSGRVTALSSSADGGITWQSATAKASQGSTVFALDSATYADFSVSIADNVANAAGDEYTAAGSAMVAGDPALVSYTTEPAPDVNGVITPSTPVWSMKGANPAVQDFALPDGVTANIAASTATVLGTSSYSFRIPPRFELTDGLQVSIASNANNAVKDAHTFHMARDVEHTDASATMGPDLDWLSDKGLADMDKIHDQVLTALVDAGTRASMYEMTGNMLESNYNSLTSVLATNEDIDMAKAIIDMKTAENTYKAALSFGARIMPTSLVDFLR
jgi:flagellin-like hook-associated protein FlgL